MNREFLAVAQAHARRWPAMEAQDFGKLAYQSEFGLAHLVQSPDRVLSALMAECDASDGPDLPPESIGNGLSRFHLTPEHGSLKNAPLLARMFTLTAADRRGSGSEESLLDKLHTLDGMNIPGWADWLAEYQALGCPVVRHSEAFRAAYRPHYRLLGSDMAGFFPALRALELLSRTRKPAIVAVDGRCGSGKTRFAQLAYCLLPCQVVHLDDFYLPPDRRAPGWESVHAGNMDLERFRREVLLPAREGRLETYRPYRCQTGRLGETVELDGSPLTLVEGSYSHHPDLAQAYQAKIFLTCTLEEQTLRLKRREGENYPMYETCWGPLEERYFQVYDIEKKADLVLDTTDFFR